MAQRIFGRLRLIWNHTRKRRVLAVLAILFALVNGVVYLQYRHRTYAQTTINGQSVGSVPLDQLDRRLTELRLMPDRIVLQYADKQAEVATSDLGLTVDYRQISDAAKDTRSLLPVANLFRSQRLPLVVSVDPVQFGQTMQQVGKAYRRQASDASLVLRDNRFILLPETNALSLDLTGSQARIVDAVSAGRPQAELMMRQTPPAVTRQSLEPQFQKLESQRNTAIELRYGATSRRFEADEIGSWFVPRDGGYATDEAKISNAVSDAGLELGANVSNAAAAAQAVKQAVDNAKTAQFNLEGRPLGKRNYSYCTAGRGVPQADIDGMTTIINSTLNAKRGWSLSGHVTFTKSTTACDFTIWLAAPDQMASFGAICDAYWSCAVKPNVIFNWDRWRFTSEPWKKVGGSLEDYRVMVINHEVGHWLGFDHSDCPVKGQAAPVMQQQSIDLQGCNFNPWPTATERTALKDYLGL